MFESSIITSGILLGGGRIRINQYKFFRDAGICIVGNFIVLSYGLSGQVWVYTGILLPIVYCIYVAIVLYSEIRWKDPFALNASLDFSKSNLKLSSNKLSEKLSPNINHNASDIEIVGTEGNQMEAIPSTGGETAQLNAEPEEPKNAKYYFLKGLEIVMFPIYLIRRVTIPLYEECTWNRYYATATPFCGLLFTLYGIGLFDVMLGPLPLWGLVMIIGAIGSVVVWFTTTYKELPKYNFAFTIYAFIQSILWIGAISDNVVTMLEIIGNLIGVPTELLACTLLTWGNGTGDFMSNYSIAKLGLSQTAITACFSGPSFDMLMGMGACFTYAALLSPFTFPMFGQKIILTSWCFFLVSTTIAMLLVGFRKGKLDKLNAYYHLGFYSFYVIMLIVVVFAI
mmetsp:Transcript_3406/g.7062  ORF Transcript_3406/g.7062 Transcript_3406/m.7062 type:complete len:397 (+) Transcript_3406:313-1503(+)